MNTLFVLKEGFFTKTKMNYIQGIPVCYWCPQCLWWPLSGHYVRLFTSSTFTRWTWYDDQSPLKRQSSQDKGSGVELLWEWFNHFLGGNLSTIDITSSDASRVVFKSKSLMIVEKKYYFVETQSISTSWVRFKTSVISSFEVNQYNKM